MPKDLSKIERQLERGSTDFLHQTLHNPLYFRPGKIQFHLYYFPNNLVCLSSRYSFVDIKPELQRNILKFGYGINYKYKRMLGHSFDMFYVITKFVLSTLDDLKLSPIKYDKECNYLRHLDDEDDDQIKQNIKHLLFTVQRLNHLCHFTDSKFQHIT